MCFPSQVFFCATLCGAQSPSTKEVRTGALLLPEKIIGGVIDIVHSHKNKPSPQTQPIYQQPQGYQQQYPPYQQWNAPAYQGNGYSQYQGQNQYGYAPQNGYQNTNYPQNGGSYSSQGWGTPSQGFSNAQGSNQGAYQPAYQPPNGQYQTQQFQQQGHYTGSTGQYYGQSSQVSQGSAGYGPTGTGTQGFQATGGGQASGSGPGPACVCQAWTKPQHDALSDSPMSEKMEKIQENVE